ncbi:MAG: hypothetical protein JW934_12725 [Anaerolineae bacterium]|nr:hypothetical protein [Anaerolineae bacterium]
MRWVLILFAGILVIFVCAILLLATPLPGPLPEPFSKGRNLMAAICTGTLGLLFLGAFAIYLVAGVLGRGGEFDPAFTEAGFTARGYMLVGREYRGTVQDRPATVRYLPPYRGQAAVIDMTVEALSGLRLAAGITRPLLDCRRCAQIAVDAPVLAGLQVYASDETSARRLLADFEAQNVFSRSLIDAQAIGTTELYIQPERVWLRAHVRPARGELMLGWLDDLAALAEAAEGVQTLPE